ncbi:hypothetical protein C9374_001295 [Naegleria lovaniensis]|uniref:Suppressor of forked domain-containing protein n=1 Tax=Naegleria lovaniensis TaxID=51637 RepID=A0AA88KNL0_NAELO|nr:uncharacterized protein C9374_001295 [Naegleria lovaniensis]KAG2387701.1 hypothetical protein C9374_001295 [Naegleria lovaniensis]
MDNYHHQHTSSGSSTTTKTPQEFMKEYESVLTANPCDYYTWEKYITLLEIEFGMNPSSLDISQKLLDSYSQFLAQFPLLFGYWKKYAELTYQVSKDFNQTVQVYEKAIDKKTGISNNPDLWSHYCLFVAEQSQDVSEIRALFERALQSIGNDYYARILWEKYIEFETSQDELENVVKLYKRAIQVPCRDLTLIWSQFKDFMKTHTPKQESSSTTGSDGKEQESSQQILTVEQYAHTPEEMNAYKASNKLNDLTTYWRENLYLPTKKELERIRPFEDHIRRPYFHVQPFQEHELEHFRRYIENEEEEFEKKNNTKWCTLEHVIQTHERFIVYCSYYTEFWNRYISFLEKQNLHDQVVQVYHRLTSYSVLKNRYQVHIQFAEYLEMNNSKPEMIEQVYNDLIKSRCIGHLESLTHAIHYLYRSSSDNFDKIEIIYREQEKNIVGTMARCYFKLQHANFVWKVRKDVERARTLFNQCIDEFKTTKKAYQALLEFENDVVLSTGNTANADLVEKLLNLEYYSAPVGSHEDDMQDEESVDRVVQHYLSLWGMPSPHIDSERVSKKNSSIVTISFKIEVLQLLLQKYVYQFQTIQTVQKVKEAIKKLEDEQYESQRKRRLENGVEMATSETKKLKSGDQRWSLDQYKQYYQQYYQYYQQFTQI